MLDEGSKQKLCVWWKDYESVKHERRRKKKMMEVLRLYTRPLPFTVSGDEMALDSGQAGLRN
jgi:hypothetical protein